MRSGLGAHGRVARFYSLPQAETLGFHDGGRALSKSRNDLARPAGRQISWTLRFSGRAA